MSFLADLFNQFKTLFRRNQDNNQNGGKETPRKESVGDFSMKDGDHGTIFGINRKMVMGIFIVIITIFAIAFITAGEKGSNSSDDQRAEIDSEKTKPASDGSSNVSTGLPQEYGSYISDRDNIRKAEEARAGKRQQSTAEDEAKKRAQQAELERKRAEEEARRRLAARPSAAEQVVAAPNYVAQQQAALAAQMRALENAGKQPPASTSGNASGDRRGSAIDMYRNKGNGGGSASGSPESGGADQGAQTVGNVSMEGGVYQMTSTALKPNMLQAGTVMPVVLCTGINSNLDGQVMAMVQQDVCDSLTGNKVLIPAGSKLIGSYNGKASSDAGRVKISFTSLIFPDGRSFPVGSETFMAMDGEGYSGVKGKVDHHTDRAISSGAIGAGIAALGSIAAGNTSNTSNTYSAGQLAMQGAMANIINSTSSILQRNANVKDTVTVKPGYAFMIYLAQPVQF